MAMLHIDDEGFKIMVYNTQTKVSAHLHAPALVGLPSSQFINNKMISISELHKILIDSKEDSLTIFHPEASNKLIFKRGRGHKEMVELMEMGVETQRFPVTAFFCEVVLRSDDLRDVIRQLRQPAMSPKVTVEIKERCVVFHLGPKSQYLEYMYEEGNIRGLELCQTHHFSFTFHHLEAVENTLSVATSVKLFLLSDHKHTLVEIGINDFSLKLKYSATVVRGVTPVTDFYFELSPIFILDKCTEILCDKRLNPKQIGRLDLSNKGLEITVRNPTSKAVGYFHLKSPSLINFRCKKAITGKLFHTTTILRGFQNSDCVNVFHVEGSSQLTFRLGMNALKEHKLDFLPNCENIGIHPAITQFIDREAVLPHKYLMEIVEELKVLATSQQVCLEIKQRPVKLFVGGKVWKLQQKADQSVRKSVIHVGENLFFKIQNLEVLKKASSLGDCVRMSYLLEPEECVMMRFCHMTVADLVLTYKATGKTEVAMSWKREVALRKTKEEELTKLFG